MGEKRALGGDLMQGTLDMLILKALTRAVMHGYAIAEFKENRIRGSRRSSFSRIHALAIAALGFTRLSTGGTCLA
jgi:hypothetical protein